MTVTTSLSPHHNVESRISAACVRGFPVASRRSLRASGLDRSTIRRRIEGGQLVEIVPNTFLVGIAVADAPPDLVRMAAVVSMGPGATLDGLSALERERCWNRRVHEIHVSGPTWRRPCESPRISYHRVEPGPGEVRLLEGIPTRMPIAALQLAATGTSPHQLAFIISRIAYEKRRPLFDVVDEVAERFAGRRNGRAVRQALALLRTGSSGTKSATEDHLLPVLFQQHGEPSVNVRGCAGLPGYEPDFCYPQRRLIIEVDGGHHGDDPSTAANDAARDELLRSSGWTIVRIPWRMVWSDTDGTLDQIAAAYARRGYC